MRYVPMLGRSGIMWVTTLKPHSLASSKALQTAATVWPRLVSRATSSKMDCTPISILVHPYLMVADARVRETHPIATARRWLLVQQHGVQMRLLAVVWARFNGDANAACLGLLRVPHCFANIVGRVATQGVVQVANKVVPEATSV